MKHVLSILSFCFLFSLALRGQTPNLEPEKKKTYMQMYILYEGDTIPIIDMRPVYVFAPMKFKNNKERQEYTKLVRDVKKTYPYARLIASSVIETYEYMETLPDDKTRQKHLEEVQKYMMDTYKPQMKKMTRNQGKILIKLIDRECNTSSYNIVKSLVGGLKAGVYNVFAGVFGNSLKAKYDPNGQDAAIESVVLQIESGMVEYYYARNYHQSYR